MATGKRIRFEIFKRDLFSCQYCGRTPPAVILEIDHVQPKSKGGEDDPLNLVTACFDCNRGKSNFPLGEKAPGRDAQIAAENERSEQTKLFNRFLLKKRRDLSKNMEKIGFYWFNKFQGKRDAFVFRPARAASIRTFLKHLTEIQLYDAVDIAHERIRASDENDHKTWKYFCGICWKIIKESNNAE